MGDKLFCAYARTCANEDAYRDDGGEVHDPIEVKEKWNKLFTKKPLPRCDGHGEPAKWLVTKKKGGNCGRGFWVCARYVLFCLLFTRYWAAGLIYVWARPVGPEGEQGLATPMGLVAGASTGKDGGRSGEWRCDFFMWGSDWSGNSN